MFVGRLTGYDASIAIVSDGERVSGHVCDGRQLSFWFGLAPFAGDEAELVARIGFNVGTVTVADGTARGTFKIEDTDATFDLAAASGAAGVYRATVGEVGQPGFAEAGWIILGDETQCGGVVAYDAEGGMPGPPLDPAVGQVEIAGLGLVTVNRVTEPRQLDLGDP